MNAPRRRHLCALLVAALAIPWAFLDGAGDSGAAGPGPSRRSGPPRVSRPANSALAESSGPQIAGVSETDDEDGPGKGLPAVLASACAVAWGTLHLDASARPAPAGAGRPPERRSPRLRC